MRGVDLGPWGLPNIQRPAVVDARLSRARVHLASLVALLDAYLATPPYTVHVIPAARPGRLIDRAEVVIEPPLEAAILVSDTAHQARAALDNLVNALRPAGPGAGIEFVFADSEAAFRRRAKASLHGVPAWAVDAIREMQPFRPYGARHWPGIDLRDLHTLAALDRHRAPHLQAAVVKPWLAEGDGSQLEARGDRKSWAEWEYDANHNLRRIFEAEVYFGPNSEQPAGVDVRGWMSHLVRATHYAVDMILGSAPIP